MNNKTVAEHGFGLIKAINVAIVNVFLNEIKNKEEKYKASAEAANKEKTEEEGDTLMDDIRKHIDKVDLIWPEMIRLILRSQKNFDFYPLDTRMSNICDKLCNCVPENYSTLLTYDEKSELLEALIDGIHDLDDFRQFLN